MPSYSRGRGLGRGAYGDVYVVYDNETYEEYAAKEFAWDECSGVQLETIREIGVLKALSHPRIARLIDVVQNWKGYIMQVMPLYSGGSLARAIDMTYLDYWQRLTILMDLLEALRYLHDRRIVHRDVKCDNIVLGEDQRGVLVDFSFARLCALCGAAKETGEIDGDGGSNGSMTRNVGTTGYIAPEVLRGNAYGETADAWSAGVVALEVTRNLLLKPPRDKAAYRYLRAERRKLARRDSVSRVIKGLLQDDPTARPGAHDALVDLMMVSSCRDPRPRSRAYAPSAPYLVEAHARDDGTPDACLEDLEDELYKWLEDPGDVKVALQCLRGLLRLHCAEPYALQGLVIFAIKLAGFNIDYSEEVDVVHQRNLELDILKATDWSLVFIAVERHGERDTSDAASRHVLHAQLIPEKLLVEHSQTE